MWACSVFLGLCIFKGFELIERLGKDDCESDDAPRLNTKTAVGDVRIKHVLVSEVLHSFLSTMYKAVGLHQYPMHSIDIFRVEVIYKESMG